MTKIDFYTGVDDKLRTACQLSHKALQNGLRVLLHAPDEQVAAQLDQLLWHYPPTAFIPHCRNSEAVAADTPVQISHQEEEAFAHTELLISLHTCALPFYSRFERVIEIVSKEPEDARLGRERYGFYRDRGYELRHFDLSQK
ncbi:MAG TPA: DNA polymerase III subunit chi [Gallionellaceae bacterium]|nr:DNA polymerase III subunit chi [Gallionellaceae bacterium]